MPSLEADLTTLFHNHGLRAPLSQPLLKDLRGRLVQKPPQRVQAEPTADTNKDLKEAFLALVATVSLPSLSQSHRTLACDALSTWLIRSSRYRVLENTLPKVNGSEVDTTWKSIGLTFLSCYNDAATSLAKSLRDLLANVLTTSCQTSNATARWLAMQALEGIENGRGDKAKFYVLDATLKRGVSACWLRAEYCRTRQLHGSQDDRLLRDLLSALNDRALGPAVGKSVVTYLTARRKEIDDEDAWIDGWASPMKDALEGEEVRDRMQIYVLPGIFKLWPRSFPKFLARMSFRETEKGSTPVSSWPIGDIQILLCCFKVGKDLGLVGEIDDVAGPDTPRVLVHISSSLVRPLLTHAIPQLRLAALTLATKSTSSTCPLPKAALELLKAAFPVLHCEIDSDMRDHIISAVRNLVERLALSSYAAEKELKIIREKADGGVQLSNNETRGIKLLEDVIQEVRDFMQWYLNFLRTLLRPGSSYQQCIMGIRALYILVKSGLDSSVEHKIFSLAGAFVSRDGVNVKKGFFKWASFTSEFRIFDTAMKRLLLDGLFHSFEDVRRLTADTLSLSDDWTSAELKAFLKKGIETMNQSGRASDADGVARSIELLHTLVKADPSLLPDELFGRSFSKNQAELAVVQWVIEVIQNDYLKVAAADFQKAIRERPVHGFLAGLQLIIQKQAFYAPNLPLTPIYTAIFDISNEVWRITKAPLCYDSPEGHIPQDLEEDEDEDMNTQSVMSFSWRAVKEAGSLLGVLLGNAPLAKENDTNAGLSDHDFTRAGELLMGQLSNIRHRGAFSSVSTPFVSLCHRCFREGKEHLPRNWLMMNRGLILSKSKAVTRRSAGLPSLIVGILTAEANPDRPLLQETFSHLVSIATLPASVTGDGENVDLPQVHALNCLKVMFTDSRLSTASTAYIDRGLEIAVSCFGSEVWAIRNCGVMLFTSLANRLFGQRRNPNDTSRFAFSTKSFFERYPSVRSVLLQSLEREVLAMQRNPDARVDMIYPSLSLIARLEATPEYDGLQDFEPLVRTCLQCRIWKVREVSARAYAALVPPERAIVMTQKFLLTPVGKQNELHGALCTVRALLDRWKGRRSTEGEDRLLVEGFGDVAESIIRDNKCSVTKAQCIDLLLQYIHLVFQKLLAENDDCTAKLAIAIIDFCISKAAVETEVAQSSVVGRTILKEALLRFIFARGSTIFVDSFLDIALELLASKDQELALFSANKMLEFDVLARIESSSVDPLKHTIWTMISGDWPQLQTAAVKLLDRLVQAEPHCIDAEMLTGHWDLLMLFVHDPITEPLMEASLPLLGHLATRQFLDPSNMQGRFKDLLPELRNAAEEEQPYTTRLAALRALYGLQPVLALDVETEIDLEPDELDLVLPYYFLLYDFLNDDDPDIRASAATLVQSVLPQEPPPPLLLPRAAAQCLVRELGIRFSRTLPFYKLALGKVTGLPISPSRLAGEKQHRNATRKNTILFQQEKQNLYIDRVEELELWAGVLDSELARNDLRHSGLGEWIDISVECLENMGNDGPLGWASKEDAFVWAARVVTVAEKLWQLLVEGEFVKRLERRKVHEGIWKWRNAVAGRR